MDYFYSGHLYLDGRHYDQMTQDAGADLSFWSGQAKKYGDSVLKLACGTGRVDDTLVLEGFRMT